MFSDNKSFNGNISNWNTSNVIDMSYMFSDNKLFNGNISNWNTSNVRNMSYMFEKAILFNNGGEPLITREITKEDGTAYTAWDVSNVIVMRRMFYGTQSFNQPILNWDTSNVIMMDSMFNGSAFSNNRIALWPININLLSYNNMFNNSGITKYSFVNRNNDKIISYNRLIAKYFNLPEEYMSIRVIEIETKNNHNINVNPIDRIIDVKKKLRNIIDITPYLQRFILGGKELDNNRTLISYEIINGSTLYLLLMDHIVIYVKTLTGKTDTFEVNPENTILSIKELIRNKNGIPIERQRLIFNSQELRNYTNLYDHNIINKSTLNLVLTIQ
jgi:surface protein